MAEAYDDDWPLDDECYDYEADPLGLGPFDTVDLDADTVKVALFTSEEE